MQDTAQAMAILKKLQNPELSSLESVDLLQSLENLALNNPQIGHVLAQHGFHHKHKGTMTANVTFLISRTVVKGTACLLNKNNMPVSLPVPLFGVLEESNSYARVLARFLPADNSVFVCSDVPPALSADGNSKVFTLGDHATYAGSTNAETVTITMSAGCYPVLLKGLLAAEFEIIKPKFILGDATKTNQFDQPINIFIGSMFTSAHTDSINPQESKTDILSDNTVRIFKNHIHITPEKTIVPMIVAPVVGVAAVGNSWYFSLVCELNIMKK